MKVVCEVCKKEFDRIQSQLKTRIFCSQECFKIKVKTDKTLNGRYSGGKYVECVICGKVHYRTPAMIKNASSHPTCNKKCYHIWRSENLIGEKAPNYKGATKTIQCLYCGKDIRTRDKNRKFCSMECSGKNKSMEGLVRCVCVNCKNIYFISKSQLEVRLQRGYEVKFCSKKCQSECYVGENHPSWIDDRTKLKNRNKTIRWSKKMDLWREGVYKRDDFTCQMCGVRSSSGASVVLNAHHIKRFSENKAYRFDIDNGITLCEDCHKLTYWKEDQFEEVFINIIEEGHLKWRSDKKL